MRSCEFAHLSALYHRMEVRWSGDYTAHLCQCSESSGRKHECGGSTPKTRTCEKRYSSTRTSWWRSTSGAIRRRRNRGGRHPGLLPSLTAVLTVALTSIAAYYTQRSMREEDFLTQQSKANYESSVAVINDAHLLANETLYWAGERDRLLWRDYRNFSDAVRIPQATA